MSWACSGEPGPTERESQELVSPLRVEPTSGLPPLAVTFRVSSPAGARTIRFELDADGDGAFERAGPTAESVNVVQVFHRAGTFPTTLRLHDASGTVRDTIVEIAVSDPGVHVLRQTLAGYIESPVISPDGSELYAWTYEGRVVKVLDAESLAPLAEIQVAYRRGIKLFVTHDGKKAYVVDTDFRGVPVVDLERRETVAFLNDGTFLGGDLAPDGTTLFLNPRLWGFQLLAVSTETDSVQGYVDLPGHPQWTDCVSGSPFCAAVVWDPDDAEVELRLALFDPVALAFLDAIPLSDIGLVSWVSIRPGANEIYMMVAEPAQAVLGRRVRHLEGIDLSTRKTFEIGLQPLEGIHDSYGVAPYEWSADGRFLYVVGEEGFFVIDASARRVGLEVPPETVTGYDLQLHPRLPWIYVAGEGGRISILDIQSFPPH